VLLLNAAEENQLVSYLTSWPRWLAKGEIDKQVQSEYMTLIFMFYT
jgi:hypothetical protein